MRTWYNDATIRFHTFRGEPVSEIQKTISRYLRASAGTANWPTDHTFRCFVGMLETSEATVEDFRAVGGEWLVERITEYAKEISNEV